MLKITFIIAALAIFAPWALQGSTGKTITTLATKPIQKNLQLLIKKGYQCRTSDEAPILNWHCLKQEKEISFTQSTLYTNCNALDLCHLDAQTALSNLFKGAPRAIKTFSVHDHNQSVRWHCLEPRRGILKVCLSSQNNL